MAKHVSPEFPTLLHGSAQDVVDVLDSGEGYTSFDLQGAITNAMRRIDTLERRCERFQELLERLGQLE